MVAIWVYVYKCASPENHIHINTHIYMCTQNTHRKYFGDHNFVANLNNPCYVINWGIFRWF